MKRTLCGMVLLVLACSSANASLVGRSGGLAYYDTATNLTWVADANLSQTSGYDTDGLMNWAVAQGWIASLNTANYLGTNDWRLPTVTDTGTTGCDFAYAGTDCGYNVDLSTGEMARMFYGTLGNNGWFNTSSIPTGCSHNWPYCLTNVGPFSNLQPNFYWSGTEYAPAASNAWSFLFYLGYQVNYLKSYALYAWAVRPGDIAAVPVPGAAWLLVTAIGALAARAARRKATA